MKRRVKRIPKKKSDIVHLGAWRRGASARWKKDYLELNSKLK
jgi:hypothetical protein